MMERFGLYVIWAVLACASSTPHAPQPQAVRAQRFSGRVVGANGTPVPAAIIIVSDVAKGEELAAVAAGEDGRFATNLRPGVYALTATHTGQSVYVSSIDGTHGEVDVRLDPNCARFEGRIVAGAPLRGAPIVRLVRYSDELADVFGAAVRSDGTFHACLPSAAYKLEPPEGLVVRSSVALIPHRGTFVYRTEPRQQAERVGVDMNGILPESAETFVTALPPSTRLMGLGETNHGTREFHETRIALALDLARKQGVRLLMLEAGYGETLALDDYVNGSSVDITRAVEELGYWTWDTKTFLEVLSKIRAYNLSLAPAKRIHVIGIDVQDTRGSIRYLQQKGAAFSAADTTMLEKLAMNSGKGWKALDPVERSAIRSSLDRIAAALGTGGVSSKSNRMALAARSLLLRFDLLEAENRWQSADVRDAGMARMVLDVLAIEPKARATLWAHLGHLTREQVVGLRTMGAHLADALGDAYRVYGLLALGGSARAWDSKLEIGVISRPLPTPPAYTVEAVLAARSRAAPVTFWTFAHATGEAAHWLKGIRALRLFGAVFMPEGREFSYWDLQSIDGAILFHSVTPTEPTPTGERRAKPKEQQ